MTREHPPLPWRLAPGSLSQQEAQFNARAEVLWFGFVGRLDASGWAEVRLSGTQAGHQGGAGLAALNGGVIAAGFDAACVLAGLGHYDTPTVITLDLSVRFLEPALVTRKLAFRAGAMRTLRQLATMEGALWDEATPSSRPLATATATVMPR